MTFFFPQIVPGSMVVLLEGLNHSLLPLPDPVAFFGSIFVSLFACSPRTHDDTLVRLFIRVRGASYQSRHEDDLVTLAPSPSSRHQPPAPYPSPYPSSSSFTNGSYPYTSSPAPLASPARQQQNHFVPSMNATYIGAGGTEDSYRREYEAHFGGQHFTQHDRHDPYSQSASQTLPSATLLPYNHLRSKQNQQQQQQQQKPMHRPGQYYDSSVTSSSSSMNPSVPVPQVPPSSPFHYHQSPARDRDGNNKVLSISGGNVETATSYSSSKPHPHHMQPLQRSPSSTTSIAYPEERLVQYSKSDGDFFVRLELNEKVGNIYIQRERERGR